MLKLLNSFKRFCKNFFGIFKEDNSSRLLEQHTRSAIDAPVIQQKDPDQISLDDSTKKINNLIPYINYFNNAVLNGILSKTSIIHQIFEMNRHMKFTKLDQFHMYYTDHLIQVLKKYKTTVEQKLSLYNIELKTKNNELSDLNTKLNNNGVSKKTSVGKNVKLTTTTSTSYNDEYQVDYANYFGLLLLSIYNSLKENFKDFRYKSKIDLVRYNSKFPNLVFQIPKNSNLNLGSNFDVASFDFKNDTNFYSFENYYIEKKLMGQLNKIDFKIKFLSTCYFVKEHIDLFEFISDKNEKIHFMYMGGYFVVVDLEVFKPYLFSKYTKQFSIVNEIEKLKNEVDVLTEKIEEFKVIDDNTIKLLTQYYDKISAEDFINDLNKEDNNMEKQNLKTILELEMLEI